MSALDLDALEALARACDAAERAHDAAADAHEEIDRKLRKSPSDPALCGMERAAMRAWCDADTARESARDDLRERCYGDTILALITRLRAAEARTAWQPIETAPPPAEEWLHVAWVGEPGYQYARLDEHGWWVAESGRFYEDAYAETPPTHWCRPQQLTWTGALPAVPEAP